MSLHSQVILGKKYSISKEEKVGFRTRVEQIRKYIWVMRCRHLAVREKGYRKEGRELD